METELTKKMKIAVRSYKPIMSSNMRTIRCWNWLCRFYTF